MLLADRLLNQMARRHPGRILVSDGVRSLTYLDVDQRSSRLAAHLHRLGGAAGDRVAVLLSNRVEYAEAVFGIGRAGMAAVPLNPRLGASQLEAVLSDCCPVAVLAEPGTTVHAPGTAIIEVSDGYEALLAYERPEPPELRRHDLDPWLIGYTSGTTGLPKGALLAHRAKSISAFVEALEFGSGPEDVALINTPLFHVHAIVQLLTLVVAGGGVRVATTFDRDQTLRLVETGAVTELSMVPTMYQALIDTSPAGTRAPRLARCTGAAMEPELRQALADRFASWPLHLFYGGTEAGAISNLRPEQRPAKERTIGLPLMGVEIEIRGEAGHEVAYDVEGDVYLRSPGGFSGYLGLEENRYGDWLSLGDLGSIDADGYLTLRGRRGDRITTGGEKVVPQEVEEVLMSHPGVRAAAVFGLPDPYWGEVVWAAVELRSPLAKAEQILRSHCAATLAPHQNPKHYLVAAELPRNSFGKVDRGRLRELAQQTSPREG